MPLGCRRHASREEKPFKIPRSSTKELMKDRLFPVFCYENQILKRLNLSGFCMFLFVFFDTPSTATKKFIIRHELIHYEQYKECLVLPMVFLYMFFLARDYILLRDLNKAYVMNPFEREAHEHEREKGYLRKRKWCAWWKYTVCICHPGRLRHKLKRRLRKKYPSLAGCAKCAGEEHGLQMAGCTQCGGEEEDGSSSRAVAVPQHSCAEWYGGPREEEEQGEASGQQTQQTQQTRQRGARGKNGSKDGGNGERLVAAQHARPCHRDRNNLAAAAAAAALAAAAAAAAAVHRCAGNR
mmetsp:Transcript_43031/g.84388  ORF Transcript_43031/g.84388 Transcript_43031/m.84388 type:complete len:296 (-) Transcript_43031:38-925(-)